MKKIIYSQNQAFYLDSKVKKYLQRASLLLFFSLVAIDVFFMGLHSLKSLGHLNDPNFSVTKNFGYAESFQYLKAGFITACFTWLATKYKKKLFSCWAAVFSYILLDDSLEIHEWVGYKISETFDPLLPFIGLGSSTGELIAFGIFGALLFIPLFILYYKSNNKNLKVLSQDLFIMFCGLTFFGIAVDLLHDFAKTGSVMKGLLGLIEDGGEMIIMSCIVWYVWAFIKIDSFLEEDKIKKIDIKSGMSMPIAKDRERIPIPKEVKTEKNSPSLTGKLSKKQ